MEKKVYEEPSVKKVEFDFNECIAASTLSDMQCESSGPDDDQIV